MTRSFISREAFVRATAALLVALIAFVAMGAAQAQGERRGFLFEIRKGSQASLLFGTIHVGRPDFYPLPASRLSHLSRIDALVLEADITDMARAATATQKYAMYGPGEDGLDKRLPADTLKRAETVLAGHGIDPRPMMRLKPWMLGSVLALFEAAQAGYVPGTGRRVLPEPDWRRPGTGRSSSSRGSSSSSRCSRPRRGRPRWRSSTRR